MIFFLSFSDDKPEGRPLETKGLPDLILNISGIGEMHQLLIIYENNKGRGFYRHLSNVVQTKSLTLVEGGCCMATASAMISFSTPVATRMA